MNKHFVLFAVGLGLVVLGLSTFSKKDLGRETGGVDSEILTPRTEPVLSSSGRQQALQKLSDLSPEQNAYLEKLRDAKDTSEQVELLHELRTQPFPEAFDGVIALQENADPMVIRGVVQALGALAPVLSPSQADEAIVTLDSYRRRYASPSDLIEKGHRYLVAKALGNFPREDARAVLKDMVLLERNNLPGLYLILENLKKLGLEREDPLLVSLRAEFEGGQKPSDKLERETWVELQKLLESW